MGDTHIIRILFGLKSESLITYLLAEIIRGLDHSSTQELRTLVVQQEASKRYTSRLHGVRNIARTEVYDSAQDNQSKRNTGFGAYRQFQCRKTMKEVQIQP